MPGTPAGDQFVELVIDTPPADDSTAREFYEQMSKRFRGFKPRDA